MNRTPPPVPQGYRPLTRVGTQCKPGDLAWRNWRRPATGWSTARYDVIQPGDIAAGNVFLRPIDRKKLSRYPICAHCGKSHYRQGMGYAYESASVPVILHELSPGRLVCTRCVGSAKGQAVRHFNLVTRLGGVPTYKGERMSAHEAGTRYAGDVFRA